MARIPTVTARVSPLAGAPQSQASGAQFGAGIGQAMQGLGNTIQNIGGQLEGIGAQRQADADKLAYATEMANTSFATGFNDTVDNYPDPSGDGLTKTTEETYDAYMNDKIANTKLTGKALAAYKIQLLEEKRIYLGKAAETESTMRQNNADVQAVSGLDQITNDIRSNGATTDAEFDLAFNKGMALLATQPGMTALGIEKGKIKLNNDLAKAHFDALAESATTELQVMALQDKLETETWRSRFTKDEFNQTKAHLNATRNTIKTGMRVEIASTLDTMSARINAGTVVPPSEVTAARALITSAGNTATIAQLNEMRRIEIRNEVRIATQDMSVAERKQWEADHVSGVPDGASAVPGTPGSFKLTYANQKKTRNRPLTRQLASLYDRAARAAGVTEVVVVSGGQAAKGEPGGRTGSTRHDHGHAGDIQLKVGGRTLDMSNPEDLKVMYRFVQEAWRLGATGIGAGTTYMGNQTIHVGYGTKAIWGSARSGGAPPPRWLQEATSGIQSAGPVVHPTLQSVGTRYNVPAMTLDGMWFAESSRGANPGTSSAGAQGPFQFTPDTWAQYGNGGDINNFEDAADAAGRYMQDLLKQFNGNMTYALMAYNWGPGSVRTWIKEGSDPNAIPTETSDYVEKVMANGGSGEAGGGPDYTGQTGGGGGGGGNEYFDPALNGPPAGYSQEQFETMAAINQMNDATQAALNANVVDYERSQGGIASTLGLNSTTEDWIQRDKDISAATLKHSLQADQVKPFGNDEMAGIANIMASNDKVAKAALLSGISNMSTANQAYAWKQIGETDKVAGYAGSLYGEGRKELALEALEGRNAIKGMTEQGGLASGDANDFFSTNWSLNPALRGLNPDIVDAMKGTADAVMAQRMRTQGIAFDTGTYNKIIEEIIGKKIESFNGTNAVMPPGVSAATLSNVLDYMGQNDFKMRSETGTLPMDKNLNPLKGWQMDGANLIVIDGDDNYHMVVGDQPVMTINPETGLAEKFVLHITKDWVDDVVANRIDTDYPAPDSPNGRLSGQTDEELAIEAAKPPPPGPVAPEPSGADAYFRSPTADLRQQGEPPVAPAAEPVSPPEVPAPSGAEDYMRNPSADYPTQAIPPGGSVVPSTDRNSPPATSEPPADTGRPVSEIPAPTPVSGKIKMGSWPTETGRIVEGNRIIVKGGDTLTIIGGNGTTLWVAEDQDGHTRTVDAKWLKTMLDKSRATIAETTSTGSAPKATGGAPANPPRPRERASTAYAQKSRQRANEMMIEEYIKVVNAMKISDAQKKQMIEKYKREHQ